MVHVGPALGAKFTQYTAEFEPGGSLGPAQGQRFVYVLEGELESGELRMRPTTTLHAARRRAPRGHRAQGARLAVIEKPYQPLAGTSAPAAFTGDESAVAPQSADWTTPPSKCAACFPTTRLSISRSTP